MYEKYAAKQREIVAKLLEEELNYTDFNSGRELKINMGAEKPQTNADRIRAMSDEELARHLHCIGWDCHLCAEYKRLDNEPLLRDQRCDENCFEHCLEWLKQPAEE